MRQFLAALMLLLSMTALAREPLVFDSQQQQDRFQALTTELRCLVCQNQNLADSDAPLAQDLRQEVFKLLQSGASDDDIRQFLVQRYGDFVLYRPPLKGNTLVLWLAPALLLGLGAVIVAVNIRKRSKLLDSESGGTSA